MSSLHKSRGFTLVELVIVILVIGILAAIAAPKFVNMSTAAKIAADESVAGALKSAVNIQTSANIVNGAKNTDPSGKYYYPESQPFALLSQSPPVQVHSSPNDAITPDGRTWHVYLHPTQRTWYIICPHADGNAGFGGTTKGRLYMYEWGDAGTTWIDHFGVYHKAGELWLHWDKGH